MNEIDKELIKIIENKIKENISKIDTQINSDKTRDFIDLVIRDKINKYFIDNIYRLITQILQKLLEENPMWENHMLFLSQTIKTLIDAAEFKKTHPYY